MNWLRHDPITVIIHKPLPGNLVSIDRRKLSEAKSLHTDIELTLVGQGTVLIDPQLWYDTSIKREKRIVNNPKVPMEFIYNYAPIQNAHKRNKNLVENQISLF